MKYYLLEVSTGDSKIVGKAVYEYDNLNSAIANFHSKLGTAMKSDLYESELIIVTDGNGVIHATEKYFNVEYSVPVVEPVVDNTTNTEEPTGE